MSDQVSGSLVLREATWRGWLVGTHLLLLGIHVLGVASRLALSVNCELVHLLLHLIVLIKLAAELILLWSSPVRLLLGWHIVEGSRPLGHAD